MVLRLLIFFILFYEMVLNITFIFQSFTPLKLKNGKKWKNLEKSGKKWKKMEKSGKNGKIWKNLEKNGKYH